MKWGTVLHFSVFSFFYTSCVNLFLHNTAESKHFGFFMSRFLSSFTELGEHKTRIIYIFQKVGSGSKNFNLLKFTCEYKCFCFSPFNYFL